MNYSEIKVMFLKSDKIAIELRSEGNNLYKNGKFFEAMMKYNEALCYAESQQQLAYAYGNRSAVYLEVKLYNQCLHNIQLARDNNYPAEKMSTLDDREIRCKEQMIQENPEPQSDYSEYFKLSYSADPKIPFIIEGLEVKTTEKYGRGIYTKRELKVGDIVCMEKAIFGSIQTETGCGKDSHKYNYCYQCLNDNVLDLIPCSSCTSTMFCNTECQAKAHRVHQYDCDMIEFYYMTNQQLIMRTFFRCVAIMNGSVDDLEKIFNECRETPKTVFDFEFNDPNDPKYEKNQLKAMLSLSNKEDDPEDFSDIQKKVIREHLQAKGIWIPQHGKFIVKILKHIISQFMSEICIYRWPSNDALHRRSIGVGKCLFGSLINHSCDPNLGQFETNDIRGLMVTKPIKKGEQLFETYKNSFFYTMPHHLRKEDLKTIEVDCDCDACKYPRRYEIAPLLQIRNSETMKYAYEMSNKILHMQYKDLVEAAKILAMKCQTTYSPKVHPTNEWIALVVILKDCLKMMLRSQISWKN